MIKLYKYFFELSNYDIEPGRKGNTQRSRAGRVFTDYTSDEYKTFRLEFDNLKKKDHINLLYITSLVFPITGGGQDLSFTDPLGDTYTVTIPVEGYTFTPKDTEEELWTWEITLEEVI